MMNDILTEYRSNEQDDRARLVERALPHSAEAERAILGGILLDNDLMHEAVILLERHEYYVRAHELVWAAMVALYNRGSEINPILLGEELRREGMLDVVGGVAAVSELTYGLPHFNNLATYAKVVKDKALLRMLVKVCNKVTAEALEEEEEADVILDHAGQYVLGLMDRRQTKRFSSAEALTAQSLILAQRRAESGKAMTGLSTGLTEFDSRTLGLQPTDLIIIAARPSAGKTSLVLNIAEHVAVEEGGVVAVFSLEMSEEQLTDRMLCSRAHVDLHRFRSGYLSKDEWERLRESQAAFRGKHLYIDDTPAVSSLYIRSRARRLALERERLDLIVVDYLQLMSASTRGLARGGSREQEVSSFSRELKALAKELRVPLIALSQLSRDVERRTDKRPQLSDLRESGAIEQDADVVAFIFREEMYRATEENANRAEIILAKMRNAATGSFELSFLREFTRFENMWRD